MHKTNRSFKEKLTELYQDHNFTKRFPENELKKLIRYGARGETGTNYYLFLYRDFYRDSADYGAVVFLNKKHLESPVTVIGLEPGGKEQIRNIYVTAALFFLYREFQDTMAVTGKAQNIFDLAMNKINSHLSRQPSTMRRSSDSDPLDAFDSSILQRPVRCREIKNKSKNSKKNSYIHHMPGLEESLELLKNNPQPTAGHSDSHQITPSIPSPALPGLSLKSQVLDLSGKAAHYFQPLLIPLFANGRRGKPRTVTPSELSKYELKNEADGELLDVLNDDLIFYFKQFAVIDAQPGQPVFKAKLLNRLYFQSMANEFFHLPDRQTFYQPPRETAFIPIKKLIFSHLTLRFAPSLQANKDYVLKFYLTLTSTENTNVEAGNDFEIIFASSDGVYILLNSPAGETFLAAPAEPSHYGGLFRFLEQTNEVYTADVDEVLNTLEKLQSDYFSVQPEPLKKYKLHITPTPVIDIYPENPEEKKPDRMAIRFDYDSHLNAFIQANPDKMVCTYTADNDFETQCLAIIRSEAQLSERMDLHPEKKKLTPFYYFNENGWIEWLSTRGIFYLNKGFKIYSTRWKRFIGGSGASVQLNISSNIDWLEFKPMLHDPQSAQAFEPDLEQFNPDDRENTIIIDKHGMLHLVTAKEIERLRQLYLYAQRIGSYFRIPSKNHILIQKLYDKKMEDLPEIKEVLQIENRLKDFTEIPEYSLSKTFNGQLRHYQQEGFKWLSFLRDYGFSGCLADDMGLGKTVQTLSLLQTLKSKKKLSTSLLVAPVSAIPNWEAETARFAPGIKTHRHMGPQRNKKTQSWKKYDLIITSYATLRNDIEMIQPYVFDYIILDESQNIKNASSQVSTAVKVLQANSRLALSGTPVENNSSELWSLFDFLMPGFLGTKGWFNINMAGPIERENNNSKAELLKKMIYPFILRRKKQEVEKDLPEKTEIISKLQMDAEQQNLYNEMAKSYKENLANEIEVKGVSGSSVKIFEAMLRLRQVCLFPQLANPEHQNIPSAKFEHLKELLEDVLAEGHKVLIFSQFVQVLKRIREYCEETGVDFSYIDGSTTLKSREQMIKSFQENPDRSVFLLSLKAGGVALNLTAADYVIIFDPWWNPAVEAQAIDRSHRIGQNKKVMVYRMVIENSIEEKMLQLQERKKELVDQLIATDSTIFKNLQKEDILDLFS